MTFDEARREAEALGCSLRLAGSSTMGYEIVAEISKRIYAGGDSPDQAKSEFVRLWEARRP